MEDILNAVNREVFNHDTDHDGDEYGDTGGDSDTGVGVGDGDGDYLCLIESSSEW